MKTLVFSRRSHFTALSKNCCAGSLNNNNSNIVKNIVRVFTNLYNDVHFIVYEMLHY